MNKSDFEGTLDGAVWSYAAMQAEAECATEPGLYERLERGYALACMQLVEAFGTQAARIAELEAIGDELANDLEAELGARYGVERGVHPAMASRYDLDMAPVAKWRELVGGEPS